MSDDNVVPFRMAPAPELMSDTGIHRLWDGGSELPTSIPRSAFNPETLFSYEPTYVLDLQRKYAFEITRHGLDRRPEFHCVDMLTFDPDPDSRWHLIGKGETEGDAKLDLLERIAYAVAHE